MHCPASRQKGSGEYGHSRSPAQSIDKAVPLGTNPTTRLRAEANHDESPPGAPAAILLRRAFRCGFLKPLMSADGVSWAITPEKVRAAVQRLVEVGRPRRIILFGSYVRGQTHPDSDLDMLVVTEDSVSDPVAEAARLRAALAGIDMPIDLIVVPESQYQRLRHRWDLIYYQAAETGQVVYERASDVTAARPT